MLFLFGGLAFAEDTRTMVLHRCDLDWTWRESRGCRCLSAPVEGDLWWGQVGSELIITGTCFDREWVSRYGPYDDHASDLWATVADRALQIAGPAYRIEGTKLVSQKESEQVTDYLKIVFEVDNLWQVFSLKGDLVARFDSGGEIPLQGLAWVDDNADGLDDLVIAFESGAIWAALGPTDGKTLFLPPKK